MLIKKIPKERKEDIISNIQQYFSEERDEPIGNLAAEQLLDFIVSQTAPIIYNQALNDVQTVIQQQFTSLEEEIYALHAKM
ncbi:DUF2164 domain-containing protein [Aneurinibacillus uraniidurans]|uniref:DUF2164 domain-containing protein n=1 Tax=Aneurinibacillus uraniidurans TaxID=2966586 RepID=UPI00234B7D33|nr:DUF2164 domain-containing protein [Aneurinibacillus sp. B1]WCN39635.1 DUF2164 domain-containing protein [Aneurinibacillus sp. B1]